MDWPTIFLNSVRVQVHHRAHRAHGHAPLDLLLVVAPLLTLLVHLLVFQRADLLLPNRWSLENWRYPIYGMFCGENVNKALGLRLYFQANPKANQWFVAKWARDISSISWWYICDMSTDPIFHKATTDPNHKFVLVEASLPKASYQAKRVDASRKWVDIYIYNQQE